MRDVRRLGPRAAVEPPPVLPASITAPVLAPPPPVAISAPRPAGAVDGATLERLRLGQIMIEARLDLHGLDQKQAFVSLMGFMDISARAGRRALLVITGKGAINQGGGVLRRNVPLWLRASPMGGRILTIASAHTRHGGEGALYVLLRRDRR